MSEKAEHTPCIEWTRAIDSDGYGRIQVGDKWKLAHRVEWEKRNGVIQDGMVIDHLCRVRHCVNTDHMEVVTPEENYARGLHMTRTHCDRGHQLTRMPDGHRQCVECRRARWRAYRLRRIKAGTWR